MSATLIGTELTIVVSLRMGTIEWQARTPAGGPQLRLPCGGSVYYAFTARRHPQTRAKRLKPIPVEVVGAAYVGSVLWHV